MPETIKKPDFWTRSAVALLQASIWYFKEHYPEQCNLPNVVTFIQQPTQKVLSALRKDELCAQLISSILTAFDNKAEGQLSGTVGTLQIALNKINTPEIAYILSGNDFSLDLNDPKDPKMLCIGNSPQMQDTFGPVISLICTVALKMMNQDNKHHSMLLLDEAPTLYIPKLENVPATGRERKIAVIYIAQDISQIVERYGKEKKDTIIANLANQFWGRVSHHETAEYISKLYGKYEVERKSYSKSSNWSDNGSGGSNGQSESVSTSIVDKEVLKATDVYNFTPGKFAYIIVDYRGRNLQGVAKFFYNEIYADYGNDPIIINSNEVDIMANYKEIQQGVRKLLEINIQEENKKQGQNKSNSQELF
jgi:type IV secretory pathway TraG/TraD family ATPase VirD4